MSQNFTEIAGYIWSVADLLRGDYKQAQLRIQSLLSDMCSIYGRVCHPTYNARLLRELLYDSEKKGAVYSPFIFNILDKRIARENSAAAGA